MRKIIKKIIRMPFIYIKKRRHKSEEINRQFSGSWYFIDQNGDRHRFILNNKLNIIIDNNKLDTKLVEEHFNSIVFIDKYGYILQINLYKNQPISIYDEAENISYDLTREL